MTHMPEGHIFFGSEGGSYNEQKEKRMWVELEGMSTEFQPFLAWELGQILIDKNTKHETTLADRVERATSVAEIRRIVEEEKLSLTVGELREAKTEAIEVMNIARRMGEKK
jgi:hypothetical protein